MFGRAKGTITQHCRTVLEPWLIKASNDFTANIHVATYDTPPCAASGGILNCLAATMYHALSVITTGRVFGSTTPVNKPTAKVIRLIAKNALVCNRAPEPEEWETDTEEEPDPMDVDGA
ncbi:hypothetical protein QBC39DRAFT_370348 [Podospora conica]|nr:hypothetical protein QBC39DRAFT_370348 [Schizothecium conicum]